MTGHEVMEAFATLARVIEDRDRLAGELAVVRHQAATEARTQYRKGYLAGYGAGRRHADARIAA